MVLVNHYGVDSVYSEFKSGGRRKVMKFGSLSGSEDERISPDSNKFNHKTQLCSGFET